MFKLINLLNATHINLNVFLHKTCFCPKTVINFTMDLKRSQVNLFFCFGGFLFSLLYFYPFFVLLF